MNELKTMKEYLKEARYVIIKWGDFNMLKDDDAIADVAHNLMLAEWRYDPTRGASRLTHRINYGKYAVLDIYKKRKKESRYRHITINQVESDREESGIILTDEGFQKEEDYRLSVETVENILSSKSINQTQKGYMRERYINGKTLQEIALEFGVSRQAVQQSIANALKNLKKVLNNARATD
jgi:DNA-directed RNA polymerase specialized sigma24 family protein